MNGARESSSLNRIRDALGAGTRSPLPFVHKSAGMGWGTFEISDEKTVMALVPRKGKKK